MPVERIQIVDTHTGGEPTRVVVSSPIELDAPTMLGRRSQFAERFDGYRRAIACEPRGSDAMVAALVTAPVNPESVAGVIFFNNVGYLGMCGHGTMGVAVALSHLGRIGAGTHSLDTPVGSVQFEIKSIETGTVSVANVPSYRLARQVPLQFDQRCVHGDVAWGGNWFFICDDHGLTLDLSHLEQLNALAKTIRQQLSLQGVTGAAGAAIDHVELIGPPSDPRSADAKNFVLCPGGAYDRSPCGTGTSAKLACLAADGKLAIGQVYRQESIVGSVFAARYELDPPQLAANQIPANQPGVAGQTPPPLAIAPTLEGTAFVNAEAVLLLNSEDPFCMGIEA